jgi:uncharacterized membrane protein YcaP (DUF421 family)
MVFDYGTTLSEVEERTLTIMHLSNEMFALTVPVLEKIARPIIVYAFLVLLLRVFGKRELAQLNPFDLVVLLSLSNTVQNAIIGNDNSVTGGLIGAFSLVCTNYLVVRFLFKHRRIDQLLEGSPTVLIENGHIRHKALAKELLTESELLTICHRQGFTDVDEVQTAVLEPGGTFFLKGKTPSEEDTFRKEVLTSLEQLNQRLEHLRK